MSDNDNADSDRLLCEACEAVDHLEPTPAKFWIPDEGVVICTNHFVKRKSVTSDVYRFSGPVTADDILANSEH